MKYIQISKSTGKVYELDNTGKKTLISGVDKTTSLKSMKTKAKEFIKKK
jgi:hypothetical protein